MDILLHAVNENHVSLSWFDEVCECLARISLTDYSAIDGSREVKVTLAPGVSLVVDETERGPSANAVLDAAAKVVRA